MATKGEVKDILWASVLASALEQSAVFRMQHGGVKGLLDMVEFLRDSADIIEQQAIELAEDERYRSSPPDAVAG